MCEQHFREARQWREMAPSCHLSISREMPDHANCRIMWFADWSWNDTRSSQTPHSLIWWPWNDPGRVICRILPFAVSSDLQIDREMPINRETPNPLKRRILWFGVSEHGALQRMERFKGWSVSRLIGNHSRSANQRMRHKNNSRLIFAIGMQNTATSRIKQAGN